MGRNAPIASLGGARPERANGPGSNGYWRRAQYRRPGTYTWTAEKAGKVKVQAIGAGSGACRNLPGGSGAFGEKTLTVAAGDTLTVVVGAGGDGSVINVAAGNGGSTSISGAAVGGTPLTLTGATGGRTDGSTIFVNPSAGGFSGPWDRTALGASNSLHNTGSPSSGSPFGQGIFTTATGGPSWVSASVSSVGAGMVSSDPGGLTVRPASPVHPEFWDFDSVDGSSATSAIAGPGAGGQSGAPSYSSVLGGGCGANTSSSDSLVAASGADAGFGAGGGASGGTGSSPRGGKGGNAFVQIFFDEVA